VSYEYRVFMVHQATESTFLHLSAEPLRDRVVIEIVRPGQRTRCPLRDRLSVLAHPLDGRPGIVCARESPRLIEAQGFDGGPAGRTAFPTKGASVSMQDQGGAQEPESPDQPQEPTPGEPGTMPDDPSPAPEAPNMPSDPDREPAQSPPDESGSS
jgi:hypothetical protein